MSSEIDVHLEVIRRELAAIVDALAAAENPTGTTRATALDRALHRVTLARKARDLAGEVAEQVLDDVLVAARQVMPRGATWAQLGERMGITGQGVGKRLGERGRRVQRARPAPQPRSSNGWMDHNMFQAVLRERNKRREQAFADGRVEEFEAADLRLSNYLATPIADRAATLAQWRAATEPPAPQANQPPPAAGADTSKELQEPGKGGRDRSPKSPATKRKRRHRGRKHRH